MRKVVLLCGPPGAGKTTIAHGSGLPVFDRDDAHWTSEAQFREALAALGQQRGARAVVIRSGASSTSRRATTDLIRATHAYLVTAPADELGRRVRARGRDDLVPTLMGIDRWWSRHDRDDGVLDFPGWAAIDLDRTDPGVTSTDW